GWPGFNAVAKGPAGARFIAPGGDEIARILARHAFLKPMTVPAGAYPGLAAPLPSVGSWSFILARPHLPDDVAYRLARALHLGEVRVGQAGHEALRVVLDLVPARPNGCDVGKFPRV